MIMRSGTARLTLIAAIGITPFRAWRGEPHSGTARLQ